MISSNEFDGSHPSLPADTEIWDVAIVGAGPAGSTAAIHLASKGRRVLLLDKDDFPRDKVCGDGLIADTIGALKRVGLFEAVASQSFEASIGTVYSPSQIAFDVKGQYLTLKRFVLDDLILKKAIAAGASFCRRKVTNIEMAVDQTLTLTTAGSGPPLRARIVFLATGAAVEIATKLGLVQDSTPSAVALRCYVRSSFPLDRLIISYDRSITPGYAWIFPLRDGEYNIGCGITYRGRRDPNANLREILHHFIAHFPLAKEIMKRAESVTPVKGARLRCGLRGSIPKGQGPILVLGESLGATFPFTGEGIGKAMESGEIAAEIAERALASKDLHHLNQFAERLEKELRPKYLSYRIAEDWFRIPRLNDFMARRIRRSRYLQEAIAGLVNETVDPKEIFSFKGILQSFFH